MTDTGIECWRNDFVRSERKRRLAAVMIADVSGYGLLGQADEEGSCARFRPICTSCLNKGSPRIVDR